MMLLYNGLVNAQLYIADSGVLHIAVNASLSVKQDSVILRNHISGNGTLLMNGTSTQKLRTNGYTLNTLQTGNASIVTLTDDCTINSQCLLASGTAISLAGNKLAASSIAGSGLLKGSSASSLVINGSNPSVVNISQAGNDAFLRTLTLANTGGITLYGHLSIVHTLNPLVGTLSIIDSLTMKSTSIANTAMVGQAGNGVAVNGLVIAERFIPADKNTVRDLATGVMTTRNFYSTWQEGGINNNAYGTHITGKKGVVGNIDAATGLDLTASGNPSLYTFNVSNTTGASSWDTLKVTNASYSVPSAFKGYRIAIRGNRAHNLGSLIPFMSSNATLRSRGILVIGDVTFTTNGVTGAVTTSSVKLNSASATGFTMIGNPYIAPIDWESIYAKSVNIDPAYWVWHPLMGTSGRYITYSSVTGDVSDNTSSVNQYIQPGQAFFIRNAGANPQLKISETDKAIDATKLTPVFRTSNTQSLSKIRVNLFKLTTTDTSNMDAVLAVFGDGFDKAATNQDAGKISNGTENMALVTGGKTLSIETRPEPATTDTLNIRVWTMTTGVTYQLRLNLSLFNVPAVQPYLKDAFTNTIILLNKGTMNLYSFVVTSNPASYNDRFKIIFAPTVLPVQFVQLNAYAKEKDAMITWVANETDAAMYEVQHSTNNNDFATITTIGAKGNGNNILYSFLHHKPAALNWYRIRAIDKQGNTTYSNTTYVAFGGKNLFSIYPNPVKGNQLQFVTEGLQGLHQLLIYNHTGQLMYAYKLQLQTRHSSHAIVLPLVAVGSYTCILKDNNNHTVASEQVLFE